MFKHRHRAAALAMIVGLFPTAGQTQDIDILLALPAATLTFSSSFIAEDAGFYQKAGLKVSTRKTDVYPDCAAVGIELASF